MKKHAVRALFVLLFSFCFLSFGSLNASAANVLIGDGADGSISFDKTSSALGYGNNRATITKDGYLSISGATSIAYSKNSGSCNVISSSKIDFTDISSMSLSYEVISSNFVVSDIWFGFGLCANNTDFNPVSYVAANACFPFYSYGGYGQGLQSPIVVDTTDVTGEYFIEFGFILPYINNSTVTTIKFYDLILYDLDGDVVGIIDVIDAIKQQYAMEDGEDFGINDVVTQHNDKMGVLSFGSDVMIQFLDLFQNTNPPPAQLTLPAFSMKIQDQTYNVWDDQTFNFSELETWIPDFIYIIRIMLPAFVWLMVLRYCILVFERNFLSK
ncbi:MAG: hypothetical protein IJ362_07400 [Oscillospiraceae bacterium]|nr:hypothetical protein [Oscillospiraceae bacterium]